MLVILEILERLVLEIKQLLQVKRILIFKKKEHYIFASKLRNHGMSFSKKYWHDEIGYNFRMTNIKQPSGSPNLTSKFFFIKKIEIQKKIRTQIKKLKKNKFSQNKQTNQTFTLVNIFQSKES